jgi:hypothetical protein
MNMTVTRKAGNAGKVCEMCGEWKMLCDFAPANKPGMFKGYRKNTCQACEKLMKQQQNKRKS